MSIADDCRTLLRALPASIKDPSRHYPRDAAARLWTALRKFPQDVDNAALAVGVDLWPAVERLAHIVAQPRSWAEHVDLITADLFAVAAACDGAPVPVAAATAAREAGPTPNNPPPVTVSAAENPAALARAMPGRHFEVGRMYGRAGAWLEPLDPAMAERLRMIGCALRDSGSAEDVYRASVGRSPSREVEAQRFRDAADLIEGGARSLPVELAAWLGPKLRAVAEAIGNTSDPRPARAVLRALGAAREGQRGRPAATDDTDARDATLAWEVQYQTARHPEMAQPQIFELVADLWRGKGWPITGAVVSDAWRARKLFLN